jgi:type II secretory pathway pseudopilin PulG
MHAAQRTARRRPRVTARRGTTLLEVVLAAVLLAAVSLSIFSTLAYLRRAEENRDRTSAAYEIASRLLLQYLDDKERVPSESEPIADASGRYRFRFSIVAEPVTIETAATGEGNQMLNQTTLVRATVFQGIEAGPAGTIRGEQLAQLTRLYNPYLMLVRNEDARNRALNRPGFFEELQRGSPARGSNPGPSAPRPPARSGPPPKGRSG